MILSDQSASTELKIFKTYSLNIASQKVESLKLSAFLRIIQNFTINLEK